MQSIEAGIPNRVWEREKTFLYRLKIYKSIESDPID